MNVDAVARLLRQFFQTQQGLREIDGQMWVPWTAAQWLAFVIALALLLITFASVYRHLSLWIQRYRLSRQQGFTGLLRQLDRVDQRRLTRQMNYDDAVTRIADVVRGALRHADRIGGGTGAYRTTGEWVQWSQQLAAEPQRQAVTFLLSLADSLKFSAARSSLADVRKATADARALIESLAEAPAAAAQPTGLDAQSQAGPKEAAA